MKLSPAQTRVMTLMSQNLVAHKSLWSCSVLVDGKRICNIDTMLVLQRLGLVYSNARFGWSTWHATDAGLKWRPGNG